MYEPIAWRWIRKGSRVNRGNARKGTQGQQANESREQTNPRVREHGRSMACARTKRLT
jgi:hypothetical protein